MTLFSQLLQLYRSHSGLSGREVARRAKIAPTVISQIEHGKYHPSHDTVERIANAMGLSDVHTQALLDARDKIADVK
jgi:transcriptional regulator with XRE-family HTH domain|tara:strand:- start:1164 stop:1394 length:231 start_codon:yes stop_codon:yes gene_type:complete